MLVTREKLLKTALRYFKDVVDKDKLEMLPGCATEVLESVLAIHTDLKKCLISEERYGYDAFILRLSSIKFLEHTATNDDSFYRLLCITVLSYFFLFSSVLTSASNKVFQSLANLIRWSDNLVIHGSKNQNAETVSEIVQSVQDSAKVISYTAIKNFNNCVVLQIYFKLVAVKLVKFCKLS